MKDILRKKYLMRRNQMNLKDVSYKSVEIYNKLLQTDVYNHADQVFTYVSKQNEVNTHQLIIDGAKNNKRVAVPRVIKKGIMKFYYISSFDDLSIGKFEVLEPQDMSNEAIPSKRSIMIVPGLAFDKSGNRIGYGGGFYDRYLNQYPDITKIALAFDIQFVQEIPVGQHDVKVDMIITPSRIYRMR